LPFEKWCRIFIFAAEANKNNDLLTERIYFEVNYTLVIDKGGYYDDVEKMVGNLIDKVIWCEGDLTYYSLSLIDPDYCVLKFTAHKGRFYSNFKSGNFVSIQ
jgi:hypothetical protein